MATSKKKAISNTKTQPRKRTPKATKEATVTMSDTNNLKDNTNQKTMIPLDQLTPDMYKKYMIWALSETSEEPLFLMFIPHDTEIHPVIWETFDEEKVPEDLVNSMFENDDGIDLISSYLTLKGGALKIDEPIPTE